MKISRFAYTIIPGLLLVIYYLACGTYLNKLGYYNHESLFYIEKARIIFDGFGTRLRVMGLTSPIIPFYGTFLFDIAGVNTLAPVLASAIGTGCLFAIICSSMVRRFKQDFYIWLLLALFVFHPGILYVACSGRGIYLTLIFFFLFFLNLFKFYRSNTTFHVSIASICLVLLIFCDYRFIWLTLFFLPLILSITIHSLNLGEQESIFRLFLSFNSPSLRRKLINKTFSLYVILFALPLTAVLCYKLLNLTHANDLNYFNESPYATWNVLVDKLSFDQFATNRYYRIPEVSLLLSVKALLFCPMMLVAVYLFRHSTYQVLTLLTPFAFIEFLHIKYNKVFMPYEYYLIFMILALLAIIFKSQTVKNQGALRWALAICVLVQLYTGWYFLKSSSIAEESSFVTLLLHPKGYTPDTDNTDVAAYLNHLPGDSKILVDDAIAYPVVAFVHDVKTLTMPYQGNFLGMLESPGKYADYMMIATAQNPVTGYTQLNDKYMATIKRNNAQLAFRKVYETNDWIIYRVMR